jgi:uncharacterized membrane protein
MLSISIQFADLLLASLVIGAMFGVWLTFNPAGLDAATYVTQQQGGIRSLNVIMPILGGLTILLTVTSAVVSRDHHTQLAMLIAATACFVATGLITRFLNQPINTIVMTWSPGAPPSNWTQLRDEWWRWHVLRTVSGIVGLCLLISAVLRQA